MNKKQALTIISSFIAAILLIAAIKYRSYTTYKTYSFKNIDSNSIKIHFCPEDRCENAVVSAIEGAKKSISVAMYSFTNRDIAYALSDAAKKGLDVKVYLNSDQRDEKYSKAQFLKKKGIAVKFHDHDGLMHNKFAVIDDNIIITGSFNWTASADKRNDENLLLINNKEAAEAYKKKFDRLWAGGAR
ncbi:MAG: phospholipase D family protein [Nitrospirae bacterium]|nr:phospholipase D family protein [Nitrospirota bacterium]